jgi:hypothetical protein
VWAALSISLPPSDAAPERRSRETLELRLLRGENKPRVQVLLPDVGKGETVRVKFSKRTHELVVTYAGAKTYIFATGIAAAPSDTAVAYPYDRHRSVGVTGRTHTDTTAPTTTGCRHRRRRLGSGGTAAYEPRMERGDVPRPSTGEPRARWVTLRARWVTLRARWVTLIACWVTLRARWVTLRARWVTL